MSFSAEIKSELCSVDNIPECCLHAQVYGLVLFAHFSSYNLSITTENKDVFDLYVKSMTDYVGCSLTVNTAGKRKMSASVDDSENKRICFEKFGHSVRETATRINYANIANECCVRAFLRGAFLACGSVSDPNKTYHLEFVVPFKKLSNDLMKIMDELSLSPKYVMRKGNHIIYFKDSESIEDFLAYIGAQNSSLYMIGVKIEKDVKNTVNRKINFELCNMEKTLDASKKQIESIEYIKNTIGINALPENLRAIALLRLENPDSSLSELVELYDGDISRSGMKHRIDKIMEYSEKVKSRGV